MTELHRLLAVPRGLTAIIGSGGKTSLMYTLAEELRPLGTVLVTTTTHILPPEQYTVVNDAPALAAALSREGVACAGTMTPEGKLAAPSFDGWQQAADFVLVEADGSKRLPAKAHESWEPVLPETRKRTVCVLGASCFGQPISAAAHRPARYAALAGVAESVPITPAIAAKVLSAEGGFDVLYVNQIDGDIPPETVKPLAEVLDCPIVAGSLREKRWWQVK